MREKIDMLGYKMEDVFVGLLFVLVMTPFAVLGACAVWSVVVGICYILGCEYGLIGAVVVFMITMSLMIRFIKCLDVF